MAETRLNCLTADSLHRTQSEVHNDASTYNRRFSSRWPAGRDIAFPNPPGRMISWLSNGLADSLFTEVLKLIMSNDSR